MSTVQFKCVSCGFEKAIPAQYAGKRVRCQNCQAENLVGEVSQQQTLSVAPGGRVPLPAMPSSAAQAAATIKFRCPLCNQKIGVPAENAGCQARCPKCKAIVPVPAAAPLPAAPVPAPHAAEEQLEDFQLKHHGNLDEPGMSFERPTAPAQHAQDEAAARDALLQATTRHHDDAASAEADGKRQYVAAIIIGLFVLAIVFLGYVVTVHLRGLPIGGRRPHLPVQTVTGKSDRAAPSAAVDANSEPNSNLGSDPNSDPNATERQP
jgi:hypothetical protein